MKTTLIVPTLNELTGLKAIMPKVKPEWCEQVIVLDGHSNDGTANLAKQMGYEVFQAKSRGLWNEYRELFRSGLIKGDIVITFSPDGNSVPEAIPILSQTIELLDKDIVIASRYACGAHSDDDTRITKLGNWLFTKLVNLLCRSRYTDALVMFRAYRREIIDKMGFIDETPKMHKLLQKISGLSSWESPMAIRASKAGLKVAEIPVDEPINCSNSGRRRQTWIIHGFVILAQILYEGLIRRTKNEISQNSIK
tara:strand:+ start:2172 stop:2927 length:756 start_codon:yes stop_codon:yes gene_type:complete